MTATVRTAVAPRADEHAGATLATSNASPQSQAAERDAALLAQHLTRREREVLGLLVEGETSQSISHSLSLSPAEW